ncbi:MAG: YkgJ family cysteine cluster protein [Labilithrix sp.]|nr:YkgJ family cysteine cluster protein [Labilithrix sp.]
MPEACTGCGTCCFSESPRHARVTGDDHERLGEDADRLVTWIGNEAFMRLAPAGEDLHKCIALEIDPARGAFLCAIYERRPQICRDLERGSPACGGELATKGERPKRALALLR